MRLPKLNNFNPITALHDILYNWWVVLLCGIIGLTGCYIFNSAFVGEKYTSKMTASVNLKGYTSDATSVSLARTINIAIAFKNIMDSKALVNVVEKELGEPVTAVIDATHIENTNIVEIYVTDDTPNKAYKTIQSIYNNYHILSDKSFNNVIIKPIENAALPRSVSNRGAVIKSSIICAFLMMILGALIIALISFFRDTVKSIASVEDLLDTKLFGTILHVNKKRSKIGKVNDGLLLTNPLISHIFTKSFEDMAIKLISYNKTRNVKSIVINSVAENEGKTTICVNLAIALADTGKKVAIVDSDFKLPSVYKFFGNKDFKVENQLGDYLLGNCGKENISYYDNKTKITVFSGQKAYKNSSEIVAGETYKKYIEELQEEFDFVIIDTPPGRVAVDAEIICDITSATLLVVRQDYTFVEPINDYISSLNQDKLLGCVFNDAYILKPKNDDTYYYYKREDNDE